MFGANSRVFRSIWTWDLRSTLWRTYCTLSWDFYSLICTLNAWQYYGDAKTTIVRKKIQSEKLKRKYLDDPFVGSVYVPEVIAHTLNCGHKIMLFWYLVFLEKYIQKKSWNKRMTCSYELLLKSSRSDFTLGSISIFWRNSLTRKASQKFVQSHFLRQASCWETLLPLR